MSRRGSQFPRSTKSPLTASFNAENLGTETMDSFEKIRKEWLEAPIRVSPASVEAQDFHGFIYPPAMRKLDGLWDVESGESFSVDLYGVKGGEMFQGELEALDFPEPGVAPAEVEGYKNFRNFYSNGGILATAVPDQMIGRDPSNFVFRIEERNNPPEYDDLVEKLANLYGEDSKLVREVDYLLNSGIENRLT